MGTLIAVDQSKVPVNLADTVSCREEQPVPQEGATSIYDAYWQARSEVFNEASKSPRTYPDLVTSNH